MSFRRALLIGAAEYGDGFVALPAVPNDIEIVRLSLEYCGYDITLLPENATRSATELLNAIEKFCNRCEREDIHIIYFSGHGMVLGNEDCIIPAGTNLQSVLRRSDLRVPTDLSELLPDGHGLIAFVIDACRSPGHEPTTKAGSGWGSQTQIKVPDQPFVRFYGCSSGQVCHVIENELDHKPVSLFSKALSEALSKGQTTTLRELLGAVQEGCQQLANLAHVELQTPRLSYGETSTQTEQLMNAPIFGPAPHSVMPKLWEVFDPTKLHCLVLVSEREAKANPNATLDDLVAAALAESEKSRHHRELTAEDTNPRIYNAFRQCWNGIQLASGARREFPVSFDPVLVRRATLPINNALASAATLRQAVRAIIEADLVVFDVTGFEPGVMMLVGVRAACRRGVTVCSHGNEWQEGQPLELPFNLQDLSICSHTPRKQGAGANPNVGRLVERVVTGFQQLRRQPRYLDLPAYDALRQLGSDMEASSLIGTSSRILVLCSYEKKFFLNWELLSSRLLETLSNLHNIRPEIVRVIDIPSPQLNSQSIYEQARRTAACIVDWSGYSPSVFVEFGVRQAVSEWGAVSTLDPQFADRSDNPLAKDRAKLDQVSQLRSLFDPFEYNPQKRVDLKGIADALVNRHPQLGDDQQLSIVHDAAWRAIGNVQLASPSVFAELSAAANSLSHPDRDERQAPQILFYESGALKSNSEKAALERRIAAWLYLDKRKEGAGLTEDERKQMLRELGGVAAAALYDRGTDDDLDLAMYIEDRIRTSTA